MSIDVMIADYSNLSARDSSRLLCYIGTRLTAEIRFQLITSSDCATNTLQFIKYNEIFHKVFGQMDSIIAEDKQRYSDEAFVGIIVGLAKEGGFEQEFANAWKDALAFVRGVSSNLA